MYLEHRLSVLLQLHLSSGLNTWLQWIGQRQKSDETRNIKVLGLGASYIRDSMVINSLRSCDVYIRRFRWLVAWSAPSHYLNQCWNIFNWTLRKKLQWNFNRNFNTFIQENALERIVCETEAILSRPQCVKWNVTPTWVLCVCVCVCFYFHICSIWLN